MTEESCTLFAITGISHIEMMEALAREAARMARNDLIVIDEAAPMMEPRMWEQMTRDEILFDLNSGIEMLIENNRRNLLPREPVPMVIEMLPVEKMKMAKPFFFEKEPPRYKTKADFRKAMKGKR